MRKLSLVASVSALALLAACSPAQQAKDCAVFKGAEANPAVQAGVTAGSVAATAATGVPVGAAVAIADAAGNAYCQ